MLAKIIIIIAPVGSQAIHTLTYAQNIDEALSARCAEWCSATHDGAELHIDSEKQISEHVAGDYVYVRDIQPECAKIYKVGTKGWFSGAVQELIASVCAFNITEPQDETQKAMGGLVAEKAALANTIEQLRNEAKTLENTITGLGNRITDQADLISGYSDANKRLTIEKDALKSISDRDYGIIQNLYEEINTIKRNKKAARGCVGLSVGMAMPINSAAQAGLIAEVQNFNKSTLRPITE
jgi:hypothetical protein